MMSRRGLGDKVEAVTSANSLRKTTFRELGLSISIGWTVQGTAFGESWVTLGRIADHPSTIRLTAAKTGSK
jgi:hypothetical protein